MNLDRSLKICFGTQNFDHLLHFNGSSEIVNFCHFHSKIKRASIWDHTESLSIFFQLMQLFLNSLTDGIHGLIFKYYF